MKNCAVLPLILCANCVFCRPHGSIFKNFSAKSPQNGLHLPPSMLKYLYHLNGQLTQLVECFRHMEEVRGSSPLLPTTWGHSSVGRALEWHSRGQGFDSPCLHHRNRKHKACVLLFYQGSPALLTPRSGNAAEPLRANAPLRFAIPSLHSLRLPCLHHRNRKHKACVFLFYKGSPALLTPRSGNAAEPLRMTTSKAAEKPKAFQEACADDAKQ